MSFHNVISSRLGFRPHIAPRGILMQLIMFISIKAPRLLDAVPVVVFEHVVI